MRDRFLRIGVMRFDREDGMLFRIVARDDARFEAFLRNGGSDRLETFRRDEAVVLEADTEDADA